MFKKDQLKAKIRELECKIDDLEDGIKERDERIKELTSANEALERSLDEIDLAMKSTPEDCKPGEYCEACHFSKRYVVRGYYGGFCDVKRDIFLCNKAGTCTNFVQKVDV